MATDNGPKPYHPGPEAMDGVHESESQILTTQEAEVGLETGVYPEFVIVSRSRTQYWLMLPTSVFGNVPISFMSKWTIDTLAKIAPVKANSFSIRTILAKDDSFTEYLLFQVHSEIDQYAAAKHGATKADGSAILFQIFTPEAQALQQGRILKLSSLAFNTRVDDIHSAMKDWGQVESIRTGFNVKMTMATATVVFKSADAITAMQAANTTCLPIVRDIGTVTGLGTQEVRYNPALTLKLAHLPRGYAPVDVKNMFDHYYRTKNAISPYHSITMPVSLITKS
ncbi:hypothetical protein BGX29_009973, partial [Mortierella sp. GBA35]